MDYIKTGSYLLTGLLIFAAFLYPGYSKHVKRNTNIHHNAISYRSSAEEKDNLAARRKLSKLKILNRKATKRLFDLNEYTTFYNDYLRHILRVRVPGTSGHHEVKTFIIQTLQNFGWKIELDEFVSPTPIGKRRFTNIMAVLYPEADRRLILAAHYDSKLIEPVNGQYFLGATDSAVPCAMLLDFAKLLSEKSREKANQTFDVSPMIVFLDGEEAFVEWTKTDSIYGSRHLATYLANRPHHRPALAENSISMLDVVEAFVLFDLIGAKDPQFFDIYPSTSSLYGRLQDIERQLASLGKISNRNTYFLGKPREYFEVEDDHEPFLEQGVPILHLICVPFPSVWHQLGDNESVLEEDTIINLLRIFRLFLLEYFDLL